MKRVLIMILVFSMLFLCLALAGCRVGKDRVWYGGLCANDCINVPNCFVNMWDCMWGDDYELNYRELSESDYELYALEVCTNSEGTGENGYVTVKVQMAEGSTGGYAVFGDYVYYVSYQVDVYDEDVLVGSAVVTRRHGELADLVETGGPPPYDKVPCYTEYFNVEITEYISGNYTCELAWIEGLAS